MAISVFLIFPDSASNWISMYAIDIGNRGSRSLHSPLEVATLEALIDAASQGVIAMDENGTILLVNEKTAEMFGYTKAELTGGKLEMLLPDDARESHERFVAGYFRSPRTRSMG